MATTQNNEERGRRKMTTALTDQEMRLMHVTADEAVRLLETVGTHTITEAILLGHLKNALVLVDELEAAAAEDEHPPKDPENENP
jgi:hypothetical protein